MQPATPAARGDRGPTVAAAAPKDLGRPVALLAAAILLAALLRLPTLGLQSFWLDESYTGQVVGGSLGHLWDGVSSTENTPPLYYLVVWLWAQIAGHGDLSLRVPSGVAGVVLAWPAWVLARRVAPGTRWAPALAALLVAVSPFAVYSAQEARTYALTTLAAGVAWILLLAAVRDPTPRAAGRWGLAALVVAWCHYYGILLMGIGGAAVVLAARRRDPAALRPVLLRLGVGALLVLPLVPLAIDQQSTGLYGGIASGGGLLSRTVALPKQLAVGYASPAEIPLALVLLLVLAPLALRSLVLRGAVGDACRLLAGVAFLVWLLPLLAAVVGFDTVLPRNSSVLFPVLVVLVAVGATVRGAPAVPDEAVGTGRVVGTWLRLRALGDATGTPDGLRIATGLLAAVLVAQAAVCVVATAEPKYRRDDWKGALRAARAPGPQLLVVSGYQQVSVARYRPGVRLRPGTDPPGGPVRSVAVIDRPASRKGVAPPLGRTPPAPAPGMVLVRAARTDQYRVRVWRTTRGPVAVTLAQLATVANLGTHLVALVPGRGAERIPLPAAR